MNREQDRRESNAKALLGFYAQEIARYRQQWGITSDREAHLNAWANARKRLKELENGQNDATTGYGK